MRCPRLRLTLKLPVLQLVKLEKWDVFRHLDGFSIVTVEKDNDINARNAIDGLAQDHRFQGNDERGFA